MFLGHCGIFSKSIFFCCFFFSFFSRYYIYFSLFFMLLLQLSFFTVFLQFFLSGLCMLSNSYTANYSKVVPNPSP